MQTDPALGGAAPQERREFHDTDLFSRIHAIDSSAFLHTWQVEVRCAPGRSVPDGGLSPDLAGLAVAMHRKNCRFDLVRWMETNCGPLGRGGTCGQACDSHLYDDEPQVLDGLHA
jgi:hypothetical protein